MKVLCVLFVSLLLNIAWAETKEKNEDSKAQAKTIMGGVYDSFVQVIPYIYSDENMVQSLKKDPAKKAKLLKNLTDISEFFKSAKHVEYFQRPGFRPSLETMNSHLDDTIVSVTNNNFAFAQKRLNALTTLCISCHSQLSSEGSANAFGDSINKASRKDFESDYAFGNYLFLVRHFEDSEKYLNLAMERAIAQSRSHELYSSMRRIISIHTKIAFNYEKASGFIKKYSANPGLPKLAKNTFVSWENSLKEWKDFKPEEVKDIDLFIKKHLVPLEEVKEQTGDGKNDISLLIAAGIFSKHLNDNPKSPQTPQLLYWLSVAERRLGNTYFFTVSDLYLKDCIKEYAKSPYAQKCYALYEENIQFGYSGSGGTDIPADERREMARLRAFLK